MKKNESAHSARQSNQFFTHYLNGWKAVVDNGRLGRLAMILLGIWVCATDSLVTATIMPTVSQELGGSAWLSWSVGAFMLGGVLACSSAGRMAEVVGLRRATVLAGVVFTLGSLGKPCTSP